MADLASLGLAVDLSQLDAADKALGKFAQSGKTAQISADVLVASAVRLGISVEEVQRRLAAANDNLAANTEQAIKLADATKLAVAANDNFSRSISNTDDVTKEAGKGFFEAAEHALTLVGHLKLLAVGAYALFPAFRGFVNAGIGKILMEIVPAAGLAAKAIGGFVSVITPALSFLSRVAIPITIAVAAFEVLSSIWNKGGALLDKYANSLRSLYSEDIVQNLEKLTKNQKDLITAEQVARATELGMRLDDANFTIEHMLKTSFDLTDASLRLQAIWVSFKEGIAAALQYMAAMPDAIDRAAKAFGNSSIWDKISGRKPGEVPDLSFEGESPKEDPRVASLSSATGRLSAIMGVAALAAEGLNRTKRAAGELDSELEIGSSFIARYSDNIKKLAEGVRDFDSWDRVAKNIERHTKAMEANSASVGKSIEFQESLRAETQLLNSTKGGLNAVTDEQIDKFVELRTQGIEPLSAMTEAGIKLDKNRAQSLKDMGEAAGQAKLEFAQANFAISNQRSLEADQIATRALNAYSASQKGAIAEQQKRLELQDELNKKIATQEQVDERAASARKLAMDTENKQLSEAARARALAADQTAKTSQVAIDAMGKSAGESYRLIAIEQTRQQLEQDASARHTTINQKELEALTEKINKTAELKQAEAELSAKRDVDFQQQTAFLSSVDQQIASVQKNLHGDGWKNFMNDGLAAATRTASAMRELGSALESNITSGLTDIAMRTKSVSEGFSDMGLAIVRAIEQMIIKLYIVTPLMQALQNASGGSLGFIGSLFGGGGGASAFDASGVAIAHTGGIVGSETPVSRYVHPSYFDNAPKFHNGGIVAGEVPIIAKKGEGVFTPGQMAAMGTKSGSDMNVTYAPVYQLTGTAEEIEKIKAAAENDRKQFTANVISTVKRAQTGRHL